MPVRYALELTDYAAAVRDEQTKQSFTQRDGASHAKAVNDRHLPIFVSTSI